MPELQPLPVTLGFGADPPLHAVTRSLGRERLAFYLEEGARVPAVGEEASFEARVAGSPVAGRARVAEVHEMETDGRRELVVEMAVTELVGVAAEAIARAEFRERVEVYAEHHEDGAKILAASGEPAKRRPLPPDTTPIAPRVGHGVLPKSEQVPAPPPETHGMREASDPKEPGRTRPKPKRHHWEVDERFRVR